MDFFDVKGKKIKGPNEFGWRPAAYGVLVKDGRLLVIHPNWDDKFSLPGGRIELGETPIEALERKFSGKI